MESEVRRGRKSLNIVPPNKAMTLEEARTRASISVTEFASLLGCSPITIYRKIEAGKIQNIQIGSRRVIPNGYYMKLIEEGGTI